ncbi:MAG: type VI secretion system protein ImpK [Pseudohongiellaceae bacterium]|jgi:type VI secretion system protein ImpK
MDSADHTIIKPRPGLQAKQNDAAIQNDAALSDQTVIKPRPKPGGKLSAPADMIAGQTVIKPRKKITKLVSLRLRTPDSKQQLQQSPLQEAATTLLALSQQMRQVSTHINTDELHQFATAQVELFHQQCRATIDNPEIAQQASYVLCSLLDETVLNTPWGENSSWSQRTLLSLFHNETYGGEKVYDILEQASETPEARYELIELIYLCLSLGFIGKLRIDPKGPVKIEQIRSNTYQLLKQTKERYQKTLSVKSEPANNSKYKLHSFAPIWLFIALLTTLAFGSYSYWLIGLNEYSDEIRLKLASIVPPQITQQLSADSGHTEAANLRWLFAQEIEQDVLGVEDYSTHIAIVLHAEELFESGSTTLDPAFYPVMDKVAKALEAMKGRVVVAGHTDNIAIRTPLYPSNWHLSLARASSVVKYMSSVAALDGRLLPEGRSDNDPIASNDTDLGRAKNRRVAINVYKPSAMDAPKPAQ